MSVTAEAGSRTGLRFPRDLRLLNPAAFTRVFREGVRSADHLFTLLAAGNELDCPRIGLAVSRKVSNRAVGRNRIKRQVREAFRHHADELPPIDIVVMAKRDAAGADNEAIRKSLATHWRRLTRKCSGSS
ncbi:MAG: ribonuclease P protein component [Gammaproteobacteria bacterium]|nr:ribonuclease P protein component [Gammaproteobacteria bacterium]